MSMNELEAKCRELRQLQTLIAGRTAAPRKAMPELAEKFTIRSTTRRFCVA